MSRHFPIAFSTVLAVAGLAAAPLAQPSMPVSSPMRTIQASAPATAPALKLPPYAKAVLNNGLTLLLMEQHEVPVVSLNVVVRAGSVVDPRGKEGVSSLVAALLRRGTKTRTADQFAEELDFIGGSFAAFASADTTTVSAEFMKKDLVKGLDLVADALMRPAFAQDEVTKLVKQRIDGIKSAKDQAQGVLGQYFNAYLYGSHPYGRPSAGDETSLAAIARDDVAAYYDAHYAPGNTVVAVVGDFSTAEMQKSLAERLGAWSPKAAPRTKVPEAAPVSGKRLLLVDKPDSTQTFYRIGNVGISPTNPDRVAIEIVNTLFGGRFTSMLNSELRIKSGLTYGAGSSFQRWQAKGPFAISSYTRNASTEKAIDLTLDTLKRLHERGISDEELASAKAYLKGQFPPDIETSDQLAELLAELFVDGLDEREVNGYYARIDAVTPADVRRVVAQYFPLDNLVFVLIGKASEIEAVAKKYAPTVDRKSILSPGF